jgi:nitrogen fixation protein
MQVVDSEGYLKVKLVGGPVGPFVPYTGATANVDLGEYEIKAGQFTLDTSPTGTAVVGTTRWNDAIGSSETTLKGGSVILKNGVDLVARVVNKVTPNTTLTKAGYAAVRVSGAQGQRLAVAYAQADSDANSADTIGLVTETIATNQEGFIMTVGQLEGVNTTGSLQGETWVDGSVLYLSPTIPGALTNIKPNGLTGHIVVMGYVEYAHAINGKIYVKIMNGWELDELHNVYINPATIANNNILQYDSADQLWKNQVLNTGLTVGTTPISSGTIGRVLFQGSTNVLQQSSSLFWDSTNNRLGVGTDVPTSALDLFGSIGLGSASSVGLNAVSGRITFKNGANNTRIESVQIDGTFPQNQRLDFYPHTSNAAAFQIGFNNITSVLNHNFSANALLTALSSVTFAHSSGVSEGIRFDATTKRIRLNSFYVSIEGNTNEVFQATDGTNVLMRLRGNGNLLLNTTTDAGFRLDVNGTARVQGQLTATSVNSSSVGNVVTNQLMQPQGYSGEFRFTNGSGAGWFYTWVQNNGVERMRLSANNNLLINTTTDAGYKLDVNGTARVGASATSGQLYIKGLAGTGQYLYLDNGGADLWTLVGGNIFVIDRGGTRIFRANANAQVTINGNVNDGSAQFQVESTDRGFLPPRMTTTQRNAIASPAIGLEIYQTDATEGKYIYKSSGWTYIG